ncbi:hypothetical protein M1589_04630 [Candidatus Marsarchaeota archaeon]|jgi:hypothetical protein|nr:hypothetical protein [Candidatus Marsarchaeota archaeon]MCL5115398.1 hypothetical protein [Candidatus Marsarchaeota archaeon]
MHGYFLVDMDGVLLDTIEPAFADRGIRDGTRMSNFYREIFLYAPMSQFLRTNASKQLSQDPQLRGDTVEFVEYMQSLGLTPMFQTRNPTRQLYKVTAMLEAVGIRNPFVRFIDRGDPGVLVDGKKAIFSLQDDPLDAIGAAIRGVPVIFLRGSYNRTAAKIFSSLNNNVHVVDYIGSEARNIAIGEIRNNNIYVVPNYAPAALVIGEAIAQHNMHSRVTR